MIDRKVKNYKFNQLPRPTGITNVLKGFHDAGKSIFHRMIIIIKKTKDHGKKDYNIAVGMKLIKIAEARQ